MLVIAVLHSKATSYLALLHSVMPYGAAQFYSFIYYVLSFSFSLLVLHASCDAVKETNARKLNQCRVYQFNVFEVNWGNLSSDFLRIVIVAETGALLGETCWCHDQTGTNTMNVESKAVHWRVWEFSCVPHAMSETVLNE